MIVSDTHGARDIWTGYNDTQTIAYWIEIEIREPETTKKSWCRYSFWPLGLYCWSRYYWS